MKKSDKSNYSAKSRIAALKAKIRKVRIISGIMKRAELGEEEENMGRS